LPTKERSWLSGCATAVVTGSDSGIGQAIAIEFAKEGADIMVNYFHDKSGAERTRAEVDATGRRAIVVQAGMREEDQVANLFVAALQAFETVDILVNNAGVDSSGIEVADMPLQVWDNAMKTNVYGPFLCARRFINIRKQAGGGGRIINITSVDEETPRPGAADYDASK